MSAVGHCRALLLIGAVGVGKTTVADAVGTLIEARRHRGRYEEAMDSPMTVVRLTAPRELVRSRLHRRHELDPGMLTWHLDRFDELTAILDAAAVEDVTVPIAEDPRATARAVLAAALPGERG